MHFSEVISLNLNKNAGIFLTKEGRDISSQVSLELTFTDTSPVSKTFAYPELVLRAFFAICRYSLQLDFSISFDR